MIRAVDVSALILDFDGTILDTETPIFEEWTEQNRRHGQKLRLSFWSRSIGTHGVVDLAAGLAELIAGSVAPEALRLEVRQRVRRRLERQPLRRGLMPLLDAARGLAMPLAIASSSSTGWVEGWLERHRIRRRFAAVCGRDHVERLKPEPDLFLLAAERLGVAPDGCLVFEDSPNGVLAARRAGMRCVAVPNRVTRQLPMPPAELILESFEEHDLDEILRRI